MVKWQDISKIVGGGTIGLFLLLAGILNMSGMSYTIPTDQYCTDCYDAIHVNSTIWEIKVEHAGEKGIIFAKQMSSRTRWVNLDRIEEFVNTNPKVPVEILVPTIKKYATIEHPTYGYLRPLKDGDTLIARQNKNNPDGDWFVIHGLTGGKTVKWGLGLEYWAMENIEFDPYWFAVPPASSEGLIGYWTFDTKDGSTSATAPDVSGEGNDGTITGNVKLSNEGRFKEAYKFFNDDGSYITLPKEKGYYYADGANYTFSAWFKTTDTSGYIFKAGANSGMAYNQRPGILITSSGTVSAYLGNGSDTDSTSGTFVPDVWNHLVVTLNGTTIILYLNGVYESEAPIMVSLGAAPADTFTAIGISKTSAGGVSFDGIIDEVMIFNRTLSATEIGELYDGSASNHLILKNNSNHLIIKTTPTEGLLNETGLVGYWTMDSEVGSTSTSFPDSSGLGKTGTATTVELSNLGRFKEGALFNNPQTGGAADAITVTDAGNYYDFGDNPFTLSAWANTNSPGLWQAIIAKPAYALGMELRISNTNKIQFLLKFSVCNVYAESSDTLSPNTWYHVALIKNSTNYTQTYINGVSNGAAVQINCPLTNSYPLYIGDMDYGGVISNFQGTIDEVRIYNRSLSDAEITQLYNGTKSEHLKIYTTGGT